MDDEVQTFELPEVFDINGDDYQVVVSGLTDYMEFDLETMTVSVDSSSITKNETKSVKVTLSDSQGMSQTYTIKVNVQIPTKVQDVVIVPEI